MLKSGAGRPTFAIGASIISVAIPVAVAAMCFSIYLLFYIFATEITEIVSAANGTNLRDSF
jgi:hypothetical protein